MTGAIPRVAVCLMGPTATGKTELATGLARSTAVEIVSVDSALVYRGMDVGTAKPGGSERAAVPHHLIDLVDPSERYSAGRFRDDALAAMEGIVARGRVPLLAGGTLLYFRALLQGLARLPPADPALRERLDEEAARDGWPALHRRLAVLDPEAAARIGPNDRQRIQRALEVCTLTGRPLSALQREARAQAAPGWRFLRIALVPADRERLAGRIGARFEAMMEQGLLEEVSDLYCRADLRPDLPSMRAVGYRQLLRHLAGEIGLDAAVADAVAATRQLARRQLTWLRAEPVDAVLDPFEPGVAEAIRTLVAEWLRDRGAGAAVLESEGHNPGERPSGTPSQKTNKTG